MAGRNKGQIIVTIKFIEKYIFDVAGLPTEIRRSELFQYGSRMIASIRNKFCHLLAPRLMHILDTYIGGHMV